MSADERSRSEGGKRQLAPILVGRRDLVVPRRVGLLGRPRGFGRRLDPVLRERSGCRSGEDHRRNGKPGSGQHVDLP